jgi:hypothetical protein
VVRLDLLQFRGQANRPAGSHHAPCSVAEACLRDQTAFVEALGDGSRADVAWEGKTDRPFIGAASQHWDECLGVRCPSRQHVLAWMANPAHRDAPLHRDAGLERTMLLQRHGRRPGLRARRRSGV